MTKMLPSRCALGGLQLALGLVAVSIGSIATAAEDDGEGVGDLVGRRLDAELAKPVNITLNRTTPRAAIERLRELHHVALLLDRRIDPDQRIDVQTVQVTLEEGLHLLAGQMGAADARIGDTLYIGPAEHVDQIRTLAALRTAEIREGDLPADRRLELLREKSIRWEILTEPDGLIDEIVESFAVSRSDGALPHDVWGPGTMAGINAPQALSIVLGQFGMTYEWVEVGHSIRIVPAPTNVAIERDHTAHGMTAAEAAEQIVKAWPHLKPKVAGRNVRLRATVGEHDDIAALISPMAGDTHTGDDGASSTPLSSRRFTLRAQRVEAIAVIRTLEAQGITVRYDAEKLRAAGIDLSTRVTLDLDQADAKELFDALCQPLGLKHDVTSDGERIVRLSPALPGRGSNDPS